MGPVIAVRVTVITSDGSQKQLRCLRIGLISLPWGFLPVCRVLLLHSKGWIYDFSVFLFKMAADSIKQGETGKLDYLSQMQ